MMVHCFSACVCAGGRAVGRTGGWIYLFSILFRFALNQCVYQFDPKLHITWMSALKIGVFMDSLMFIRNRQFAFAFCMCVCVLFTCFLNATQAYILSPQPFLCFVCFPCRCHRGWENWVFSLCFVCAIMVFHGWTSGNLRYVFHRLRWCTIRIFRRVFCRFAVRHESV